MRIKLCFITLLFSFLLPLTFAADKTAYQSGKIVSIDKRAGSTPTGGSDAKLSSNVANYDVVINTGGADYTCVYQTSGDLDPTWAAGKEAEMRVKGKTIYVKRAAGSDAECRSAKKK